MVNKRRKEEGGERTKKKGIISIYELGLKLIELKFTYIGMDKRERENRGKE